MPPKSHLPLAATLLTLTAGVTLFAEKTSKEGEALTQTFGVDKMDRTVDPRADFAKYAAGGWYARTQIPADKARWGAIMELAEINIGRLKIIAEEAAAKPGAPGSPAQQVGDFYASAIDVATINKLGLGPIAADLAAIDAAADREQLLDRASDMHLKLGSPFFGAGFGPDAKESDRYAFGLYQGGMSLPSKEYYFSAAFERERGEFTKHVAKMLELAGDAPAAAAERAKVVFEFEKALAANAKLPVDLRDRMENYHKMTIAEAAAAYPGISLTRFTKAIGLPEGVKDVVVGQPKFYEGLSKAVLETPLADLKSYLRWQLLRSAAPYLAEPFGEESFRFYGTVLSGTPSQEPRWQRGIRVVDGSLGEALGKLYVDRHYPPEAKAKMDEMIRNIQAVFRSRIEKLEWMSDETRAKALAKFDRFEPMIGYPAKWKDYSEIEIRRDDFFGNIVRTSLADSRRVIDRAGQKVDRGEWGISPPTVNAYYSPSTNQIVFPAGILQPPFFDFHADDAVNYGAIGAIIGHEITHGFDDQGRNSDADGNLTDWWSKEDDQRFRERAKKLVDQFNGYQALPGLAINGQLSLGENIADLGGTSIAFEALQRSLQGKKVELIDGLTQEQRFFISWAQQWRTLYRDDAMRMQVARGPHAPGNFRAYGPLVNQQEFFDAFGIQEGDPMWRKPEERCKIW
jgi:putative endopeptidase